MATADAKRPNAGLHPVHEAYHDSRGETSLSATLIDAIAAARDVDPTNCDLELYEVVDLEALNALFDRRSNGGNWRFEFSVEELLVVVEGDGTVRVYEQ